jgi:hypothetical protein
MVIDHESPGPKFDDLVGSASPPVVEGLRQFAQALQTPPQRDAIEITTGPKVQAVQHHGTPMPRPDAKPGEHLWIVASFYRVNPSAGGDYHLDTENLMTIEGPTCFHCELSPSAAAKRCPGDPPQ